MTVLTLEQLKRLETISGFNGPGPWCDACKAEWLPDQQPWRTAYGPFVVWCCHPCHLMVQRQQEEAKKSLTPKEAKVIKRLTRRPT